MLGRPSTGAEVFYRDWRALDTEYLLIGRVSVAGQMRIEYELFDVLRQTSVYSGVETGPVGEARMLGHRVADAVYEKAHWHSRRLCHPLAVRLGYPGPRGQRLLAVDPGGLRWRPPHRAAGVAGTDTGADLVPGWQADCLCLL